MKFSLLALPALIAGTMADNMDDIRAKRRLNNEFMHAMHTNPHIVQARKKNRAQKIRKLHENLINASRKLANNGAYQQYSQQASQDYKQYQQQNEGSNNQQAQYQQQQQYNGQQGQNNGQQGQNNNGQQGQNNNGQYQQGDNAYGYQEGQTYSDVATWNGEYWSFDGEAPPFDMTSRAFKYSGCAAIKTYDTDRGYSNGNPMIMDTYAVFRLCPADKCNKYSLTGCGKNYGEYAVEMKTYLNFVLGFYEERYEEYCGYCEPCDYEYQALAKTNLQQCYAQREQEQYQQAQQAQQQAWQNYYNANYGDMSGWNVNSEAGNGNGDQNFQSYNNYYNQARNSNSMYNNQRNGDGANYSGNSNNGNNGSSGNGQSSGNYSGDNNGNGQSSASYSSNNNGNGQSSSNSSNNNNGQSSGSSSNNNNGQSSGSSSNNNNGNRKLENAQAGYYDEDGNWVDNAAGNDANNGMYQDEYGNYVYGQQNGSNNANANGGGNNADANGSGNNANANGGNYNGNGQEQAQGQGSGYWGGDGNWYSSDMNDNSYMDQLVECQDGSMCDECEALNEQIYLTCDDYICGDYYTYCSDLYGDQNQVDLSQFLGCTEYETEDGDLYYIAPHCGSDHYTISLGVYSDENCLEYIGEDISLSTVLGFSYDDDDLFKLPKECISCDGVDEDGEDNDDQQENQGRYGEYVMAPETDEDGVVAVCRALYEGSAQCNMNMNNFNQISRYMSQYELDIEKRYCAFIENIIYGAYDESGEILLQPESFDFSDWRNPRQYRKLKMPVGQAIFLSLSIILLIAAAAAAVFTHRSITRKNSPWRPKRMSNDELEHTPSGIGLARSQSGPGASPLI